MRAELPDPNQIRRTHRPAKPTPSRTLPIASDDWAYLFLAKVISSINLLVIRV
jgi:hypothetical protein